MNIIFNKVVSKTTQFTFRSFTSLTPKQEYEKLFEFARRNLIYKCGNLTDMPSRYGMFRRWRLEKKINYNNVPIFLYAYRAFIDALATHDK